VGDGAEVDEVGDDVGEDSAFMEVASEFVAGGDGVWLCGEDKDDSSFILYFKCPLFPWAPLLPCTPSVASPG